MTRYGKGTAINLTRITSPDQINVINDNFRKIQTQLMGVKNYLEPIAQAGQDISDWIHQYIGYEPPVSHPQMVNYAQKQIAMGPTPPDDPDVGDVWFVTDDSGNVIAIRHWDGTQWVDDVNNQAIQDAIAQAQQETEEAKQQAQDAVDRANQAVQSANDAIQQAQQGFDAAQEALTNATNAQSKADDAMTQAQTAFDNAQNALTTAQNALDATNILSQKVDVNTGDISTLYQTTDRLGSRITTAEGNISDLQQTDASFATRITDAEGNISTLTQTVQGLQTSVQDNAGNISTLTQTVQGLQTQVSDNTGNISSLQQMADSLLSRITDAEGDISTLNQTATSLTSRVTDAEGDISALQQTSDSFATRISNAEGNISSLTQTVSGLQTSVSDVQGNVSTLTQTADSLQSRLTTAEGNISLLSQTTNGLVSLISQKADQSWVSSQISQLSDAINLRVQKNDVINQINISTEGILIDGKKIHITGQTTIDNAVIKDAMIESVSASKISATSLSAISANLGNVTAGTLTGVVINGSEFHVNGPNGSIDITNQFLKSVYTEDTSAYETVLSEGRLVLSRMDNVLGTWTGTFDGKVFLEWSFNNFYNSVDISPTGITFTGRSPETRNQTQTLIIGCDGGSLTIDGPLNMLGNELGELGGMDFLNPNGAVFDKYGNIAAKDSVSSGAYWNIKDYSGKVIVKIPWGSSPSPMFFYPQGSNHGLEFVKLDANSSGDHVGIRGAGQAILKFLSSSDTVQIRTTSDTAYGTIYAAAFNSGSLAEYKQDITPWQESVWDIVKNMTLYKYRLKSEVEKGVDKIRYGFVIGEGYDAPPEHIVTPEGEGVEQYLMNSLSLKGLQEAIFTIENILQQLENFNQRISSLEQKIV